ncbi:MAG: hypothetical protein WBO36_03830 [Saprospiraceae bacterium]
MNISIHCPDCNTEVMENYDVCWKCNYDFIRKEIISPEIEKTVREISCIRCHATMTFVDKIEIHEGKNWGIHLLMNYVYLKMYVCETCKKVELFAD